MYVLPQKNFWRPSGAILPPPQKNSASAKINPAHATEREIKIERESDRDRERERERERLLKYSVKKTPI